MDKTQQALLTPKELLATYAMAYDERLNENRVYTPELESLPNDIKEKIKEHVRTHSKREIHLSSASDPLGVKHLPDNSQALMFHDAVNARLQREAANK